MEQMKKENDSQSAEVAVLKKQADEQEKAELADQKKLADA